MTLPLRLRPKPCPYVGGFFDKVAYLVCDGVYSHISQEDVSEHPPGFKLLLCCLPACDWIHPLLGHQEACICKGGEFATA